VTEKSEHLRGRLKQLQDERRHSRRAIAKMLGIHLTTLCNHEQELISANLVKKTPPVDKMLQTDTQDAIWHAILFLREHGHDAQRDNGCYYLDGKRVNVAVLFEKRIEIQQRQPTKIISRDFI